MRIHFSNPGLVRGDELAPIIKWMAQQFNATGTFEVSVYAPNKYLTSWRVGGKYVTLSGFDDDVYVSPPRVKKLHYRGYEFEIDPYELQSSKEKFVHDLAYGLAASTLRKARKPSRRRVLAMNKATSILEEFRKADKWFEDYAGQAQEKEEAAKQADDEKWAKQVQKKILKDSPEAKIAALETRRSRWRVKFVRAQRALRQIDRRIKRLQK